MGKLSDAIAWKPSFDHGDLKPCPFCGGVRVAMMEQPHRPDHISIACWECDQGMLFIRKTEAEAIAGWNEKGGGE